jgi:hypothetical protein
MLVLMGHTNFAAPPPVKAQAYASMVRAVMSGDIETAVRELPLEQVGAAWSALQEGSHVKLVLVP